MKKNLLITLPILGLLVTSNLSFFADKDILIDPACDAPIGEFSNDPKGQYIGRRNADDNVTMPKTLKIHYRSEDDDYNKRAFWIWCEGVDGVEVNPIIEGDWMTCSVDLSEYPPHTQFGFLVKDRQSWGGKTEDAYIDYAKFPPNAEGHLDIWAYPEVDNSISLFATEEETQGGKIISAEFKDWKTIHVKCNIPALEYSLYAFTNEYYSYNSSDRDFYKERFKVANHKFDEPKDIFDITFINTTPASIVYRVETIFPAVKVDEEGNLVPLPSDPATNVSKMKLASMLPLYKTARFEKFYTYDGDDLGAVYSKEKTTFKVWAPICAKINLRIYNAGAPISLDPVNGTSVFDVYKMNYLSGGIWSCEVKGDLNGKYYTFECDNSFGNAEVCDPYARATGVNGMRGMILDFDSTDPEGWDDVPDVWDGVPGYDITSPTDLAVYEVHIRDLTMDDTWNGTEKAGTYKAFAEKGTRYTDEHGNTVKTGHDHINELGVNAVQILPFFDNDNNEIDKVKDNNKIDTPYNWGYNPTNYNTLEGAYSSDPFDGSVRVKEFKELIHSYATDENHTRVIMDSVFNHTATAGNHSFTKLMPKYYYRTTSTGAYHDGAGCGNEIKTEATMMRKFIVDSVKWWASEYKIKGFRFDLMKLIDVETMRQVKDAVYAIDKDNVCYGEGWALGFNADAGAQPTDTGNVYAKLGRSTKSPGHLGAFSDTFRNALKGSNDQGFGSNDAHPGWGLISQGSGDVGDKAYKVAQGMKGIHEGAGANSEQTINYASCHDNWTLYDQLLWTLGVHNYDEATTLTTHIAPDFNVIAEAMLAVQSAVTFASGISFYNGGEELYRHKVDNEPINEGEISYVEDLYGEPVSHNSYKSSDETNAFKYDRKIAVKYGENNEEIQTKDYFDKYCEMIKARHDFKSRISYPDNVDSEHNYTSTWFVKKGDAIYDANGSTGFGYYVDYNNATYWMFFSGRVATTLNFDAAHRSTCIYNSLKGENTYLTSSNEIVLSPRQFLVFKAN